MNTSEQTNNPRKKKAAEAEAKSKAAAVEAVEAASAAVASEAAAGSVDSATDSTAEVAEVAGAAVAAEAAVATPIEAPAIPEPDVVVAADAIATQQQQARIAKAQAARQKRAEEMAVAQKKARKRKIRKRVLLGILIAIVVVLLALVILFCANRWWLHDDAYDIQGTWAINGTDSSITFTEDSIILTDEVSYQYKIDSSTKTIEFSLGSLSGQGHYRFSLDRNQLSVVDGEMDWTTSLFTDAGYVVNAVIAQFGGTQLTPAIESNSIGFTRE